jgi:hypothetical protein
MRNLILLLLLPTVMFSQQDKLAIRVTTGWNNTFDETYYVTTLDWNGLSMVANGTARNITLLGNQIGGAAAQIADIFTGSNKPPMIVKDGDVTYYNYQDKIITEELKRARSMAVSFGLEAGLYLRSVNAAFGIRTSKYKYIMPDLYADFRVSPWWVYADVKSLLTGFQYEYETYQTWLGLITVGYTAGIDAGYPGIFTKFAEKRYSGLTVGVGSTVRTKFKRKFEQVNRDVAWRIEGFKHRNAPKDGLSQSGIRVSVSVSI